MLLNRLRSPRTGHRGTEFTEISTETGLRKNCQRRGRHRRRWKVIGIFRGSAGKRQPLRNTASQFRHVPSIASGASARLCAAPSVPCAPLKTSHRSVCKEQPVMEHSFENDDAVLVSVCSVSSVASSVDRDSVRSSRCANTQPDAHRAAGAAACDPAADGSSSRRRSPAHRRV
jgi:hypothetical protein